MASKSVTSRRRISNPPVSCAAVAASSSRARRSRSRMEATTLNPFFASSIAVSRPMPLDEPVTIAMLSGMVSKAMGLLYHEVWPAQDGLPDHSQELSLGAWRIDANYDQCENTAQQLFPFPSLTRSVFLD